MASLFLCHMGMDVLACISDVAGVSTTPSKDGSSAADTIVGRALVEALLDLAENLNDLVADLTDSPTGVSAPRKRHRPDRGAARATGATGLSEHGSGAMITASAASPWT